MINYFEVIGLHGKGDYHFTFKPDLNILTGKNGSGKTTLLKLIWYCLSGNVDRIRQEITFQKALLETSDFKLIILQNIEEGSTELNFTLEVGGIRVFPPGSQDQTLLQITPSFSPRLLGRPYGNDGAEHIKAAIASISSSSLFFPTFRRIEGGYSVERKRRVTSRLSQNPIQEALSEFSDNLENGNNHFVASVSTDDIVNLLTSKFAEISEQTNRLHVDLSNTITKNIQATERILTYSSSVFS